MFDILNPFCTCLNSFLALLFLTQPYRLERPRGVREYRVYLTLFESDRIPRSWVQLLNSNACEVWTTTSWMVQGLRASGVYVPIKVMPIGTEAPSLWPPWHVSSHKPAFTFLVLANLQPRKGVVETATAFVAAFGPNNASVALRIHAKWGDHDVLKDIESFRKFSNIHVSIGTIDEAELKELWREADCVVALSKGEGWGLIPREALSIGIPVMVSDLPCWSDLRHESQLAGQGRTYFVKMSGRETASYAFTSEDTGHFFSVDETHAQRVFLEIFDAHSHTDRVKPWPRELSLSWHQVAQLYAAELEKQVIVFAKSLGIACGISSYTYDLFGDMQGVGFARTWSEVFVFARMFSMRVLHIQHEHGLHWDDNEFLHTLFAFQRRHPNVSMFVTLHSLHLGQQDRRAFYYRSVPRIYVQQKCIISQ